MNSWKGEERKKRFVWRKGVEGKTREGREGKDEACVGECDKSQMK